jgi:hypothetical protein
VLAVLAVVAAGTVAAWPQPDRLTRENYDRIQVGMSRGQVEAILGSPNGCRERLDIVRLTWEGDEAGILVFLSSDQVMFTYWSGGPCMARTRLDDLIWRAKRRWHRWFPE